MMPTAPDGPDEPTLTPPGTAAARKALDLLRHPDATRIIILVATAAAVALCILVWRVGEAVDTQADTNADLTAQVGELTAVNRDLSDALADGNEGTAYLRLISERRGCLDDIDAAVSDALVDVVIAAFANPDDPTASDVTEAIARLDQAQQKRANATTPEQCGPVPSPPQTPSVDSGSP